MIDNETLERDRQDFQRRTLDDQVAQILVNLRRLAVEIVDPMYLVGAKQFIDETAWFCEWAIPSVEDVDTQATLLECARLMSRCRVNWADVETSAELRRWVARDMRMLADRIEPSALQGERKVS